MTRRLSKEDILQGTSKQESLHLNDYGAEVLLRPLSDGELSKIIELLGNVPLKEDGTPDTTKVDVTKNLEALRMAASLGLVDPKLSKEEVGAMKFGVPEQIGTRVLELSGVAFSEQDLKKRGAKSNASLEAPKASNYPLSA